MWCVSRCYLDGLIVLVGIPAFGSFLDWVMCAIVDFLSSSFIFRRMTDASFEEIRLVSFMNKSRLESSNRWTKIEPDLIRTSLSSNFEAKKVPLSGLNIAKGRYLLGHSVQVEGARFLIELGDFCVQSMPQWPFGRNHLSSTFLPLNFTSLLCYSAIPSVRFLS